MASATIITGRSLNERHRPRRAFTLVEVLVSAFVGSILAGMVMSAVVVQTKLGASVGNYEEMNRQGRIVLKTFESDMRQARTLLATPSSTNGYDGARTNVEVVTRIDLNDGSIARDTVCYGYDAEAGTLWREQPSGSNRRILLRGVSACRFSYFGLNDNPLPSKTNPTPSPVEVRKIMLSATLARKGNHPDNKDNLVSAVVVLRKPLL